MQCAAVVTGLTLVVSPLLSLMADQLEHLPPALPGAALRSDQDVSMLFETLDRMRAGKLKVLFVSPERQGLTLVHFSAQPEPFLKQNTPWTPLIPPNTP